MLLLGPQYVPIMAQGTHTKRDFIARNEQGAIVMGYIKRKLNAQDLPWVMAWLQGEPEGMIVGLSRCLLNGGIFPLDHIPEQSRSILEREERIQSRSGSEWESSSVYSHAYHEANMIVVRRGY